MSKTTSPSVGKPYGLERVCRVLEIPRSTIYAQERLQAANVVPLQRARLGPKPKVSDADLLAAIRADLAASPFKIGNRFAALQPIAQGLKAEFGATGADAGRGLILRMDNGTQYERRPELQNRVQIIGAGTSTTTRSCSLPTLRSLTANWPTGSSSTTPSAPHHSLGQQSPLSFLLQHQPECQRCWTHTRRCLRECAYDILGIPLRS